MGRSVGTIKPLLCHPSFPPHCSDLAGDVLNVLLVGGPPGVRAHGGLGHVASLVQLLGLDVLGTQGLRQLGQTRLQHAHLGNEQGRAGIQAVQRQGSEESATRKWDALSHHTILRQLQPLLQCGRPIERPPFLPLSPCPCLSRERRTLPCRRRSFAGISPARSPSW